MWGMNATHVEPETQKRPEPVATLDLHGAACRCLLRLRENKGLAGWSDTTFIARYLSRYPQWRDRPGQTDALKTCELGRDLGLGDEVEVTRDYDRVLQEHRAGRSILIYSERAPEPVESTARRRFAMVIVAMDEHAFSVWCPYPSGLADTLPRANRLWWDRWLAVGFVFSGERSPEADAASAASATTNPVVLAVAGAV
jgi:hypothetical protein